MNASRILGGALGALFGLTAAGSAQASMPAGVWVKATEVTYESLGSPLTVIVRGTFLVYDGDPGGFLEQYTPPTEGRMYFSCPAGQEAMCQMQWKEIEANIADPIDVCVGFGEQKLPVGTVYPGDIVGKPDLYNVGLGVVGGFTPCVAIKEHIEAQGSGGSAGSGGSGPGGAGGASGGSGQGTGGGQVAGGAGSEPGKGGGAGSGPVAGGAGAEPGKGGGAGAAGSEPGKGGGGAGGESAGAGGEKPAAGGASAAGGKGSEAGGTASAGRSTGSSVSAVSESQDDGGCSMTARERAGGAWALGALGLAWLVGRLRRGRGV